MKPLIFAACDRKYYDKYAHALLRSARSHGMKCEIYAYWEDMPRERASVLRYMKLPDMLLDHDAVLVLDVDSIINEPIDIPDIYDLGLYLRKDFTDTRKKVMGSAFYITARAVEFAENLRSRLEGDVEWYDDQIALYKLYLKYRDRFKTKEFGDDFINWDFKPAPIWTGKGNVKFENPFLKKLKSYDIHRV